MLRSVKSVGKFQECCLNDEKMRNVSNKNIKGIIRKHNSMTLATAKVSRVIIIATIMVAGSMYCSVDRACDSAL